MSHPFCFPKLFPDDPFPGLMNLVDLPPSVTWCIWSIVINLNLPTPEPLLHSLISNPWQRGSTMLFPCCLPLIPRSSWRDMVSTINHLTLSTLLFASSTRKTIWLKPSGTRRFTLLLMITPTSLLSEVSVAFPSFSAAVECTRFISPFVTSMAHGTKSRLFVTSN